MTNEQLKKGEILSEKINKAGREINALEYSLQNLYDDEKVFNLVFKEDQSFIGTVTSNSYDNKELIINILLEEKREELARLTDEFENL